MDSGYLTRIELAKRWRCSRHSLDNIACRGEGPPYRILGGKALYSISDVEQFEATRKIEPATKAMRSAA